MKRRLWWYAVTPRTARNAELMRQLQSERSAREELEAELQRGSVKPAGPQIKQLFINTPCCSRSSPQGKQPRTPCLTSTWGSVGFCEILIVCEHCISTHESVRTHTHVRVYAKITDFQRVGILAVPPPHCGHSCCHHCPPRCLWHTPCLWRHIPEGSQYSRPVVSGA